MPDEDFDPIGSNSEAGVSGYSDGIQDRDVDDSWPTQEEQEDYDNGYNDGAADRIKIERQQ